MISVNIDFAAACRLLDRSQSISDSEMEGDTLTKHLVGVMTTMDFQIPRDY